MTSETLAEKVARVKSIEPNVWDAFCGVDVASLIAQLCAERDANLAVMQQARDALEIASHYYNDMAREEEERIKQALAALDAAL